MQQPHERLGIWHDNKNPRGLKNIVVINRWGLEADVVFPYHRAAERREDHHCCTVTLTVSFTCFLMIYFGVFSQGIRDHILSARMWNGAAKWDIDGVSVKEKEQCTSTRVTKLVPPPIQPLHPLCYGVGYGAIFYWVTSRRQQPIYIRTWNC